MNDAYSAWPECKWMYGKPKPVYKADREWLEKLDEKIWDRSKDSFGYEHAFENCTLPKGDLKRILDLIKPHCLPCVLHSGVYGGLSMSIYNHSDTIDYLDVPNARFVSFDEVVDAPDYLICIGQKHIAELETAGAITHWNKRFEWFSKHTHTDENRKICKMYHLPEPGERQSYEY